MSSYVCFKLSLACGIIAILFGSLATLLSSLKSLQDKACLNRFIVEFPNLAGAVITAPVFFKKHFVKSAVFFKPSILKKNFHIFSFKIFFNLSLFYKI